MKRTKAITFVLLVLVVLIAGGYLLFKEQLFPKTPVSFDPPYPEFNADGDPILAVYEGRIPCVIASDTCEKLKVELTLYHDPKTDEPTSYWLGYVGTRGNDRVIEQGQWTIQSGVVGYPTAEIVALDLSSASELRYFWRVNEDILLVLDKALKPRIGDAAWGFMLSRYDEPYGPRIYE